MEFSLLYKGLILGFSVAAPVGPIGILCINRTVKKGFRSGIISGLGAATADLMYGLIAALGLGVISNFLIEHKIWVQIIGAILLLQLSIITILADRKSNNSVNIGNKNYSKDYISTFALVVSNPVTILFFLAVFANLGLGNSSNSTTFSNSLLVLGVFLGSSLWWLTLSSVTYKIKHKLNTRFLKRIDLFSGILLLAFCVGIVYNLLFSEIH